MRTLNDLIAIAKQAGSTATTPAGAIRYLRAHGLPKTSPTPILSPAEARAQRVQKYLKKNISWQYHRSKSRWAGGDHETRWTVNDTPTAACYANRVWSDNGNWSGTDSYATVTITQRAITLLGVSRLYIGGLLTLDAELVSPRVYRAAWVEQSRGVSVRVARGYIVRGYHVETDDLDQALRAAGRARRKTLASALIARVEKRAARAEAATVNRVWISEVDSVAGGNCPSGTAQAKTALARYLHATGDIGAVRADVVLRVLPTQGWFIRRAIIAARQR